MTQEQAMEIYRHPYGRTKKELHECLRVLNNSTSPVLLGEMQWLAIQDAIGRLTGYRIEDQS